MASTALAPAFDQRRPAPLSRLPTMRLQALSTMPDPTGKPRLRQRSQRIRSILASQVRMQAATASSRQCRFRAATTRSARPASSYFLIQPIHASCLPLSGVTACTAADAYSRA